MLSDSSTITCWIQKIWVVFRGRPGYFLAAHSGTCFLKDFGEIEGRERERVLNVGVINSAFVQPQREA